MMFRRRRSAEDVQQTTSGTTFITFEQPGSLQMSLGERRLSNVIHGMSASIDDVLQTTCGQQRVTLRSSGAGPSLSGGSCGACPSRSRLAALRRARVAAPPSSEGAGLMQGVEQRELLRSHCSRSRSSSPGLGPPPATKAAQPTGEKTPAM